MAHIQQVHEKVLSITNHGENANQYHNVYHFTPVTMSATTKEKVTSVSKNVDEGESLYTAGGNVKWWSHYGKQYGDSSKTKNRTTVWSSNLSSEYTPTTNEISYLQDNGGTPLLIIVLFTVAKISEQFKYSSWMDGQRNCAYNGILFSLRKQDLAICDNVNKPGGLYAKWNKPETERKSWSSTCGI